MFPRYSEKFSRVRQARGLQRPAFNVRSNPLNIVFGTPLDHRAVGGSSVLDNALIAFEES